MNERRRIPGPSPSTAAVPGVIAGAQRPRSELEKTLDPSGTLTPPPQLEPNPLLTAFTKPVFPVTGVGNIAKGIASVMSEVGTITKSGTNKYFNYKYVTLEDLLFAITPLMGKHGVVIMQNEIERSLAEKNVTVTYEFSVFHTSGEIWPEKPRFTGMCSARDSKGGLDDKAINKCHSAARKYFLLSLFQVPAGDFDDADQGSTQSPPVPVPQRPAPPPVKRAAPTPVPAPVPTPAPLTLNETKPHRIVLGAGFGADAWAVEYIKRIGGAQTQQELNDWDRLNDKTLQALHERHGEIYDRVYAAAQRRATDLEAPPVKEEFDPATGELAPVTPPTQPAPPVTTANSDTMAMPDPKKDPVVAINWVAQRLNDFNTYEAAEAFWNQFVTEKENDFDQLDWENLYKEWQRVELRFGVGQ